MEATLADLRQAWVDACLSYQERRAIAALSQALALYSPETVCIELLQKGLRQIGQLWYTGAATVQQEHFASALAIRRLGALLAAAPPPAHQPRILIGCPPEEEHTFSPLLLSYFLRLRGWDTIYLGANIPLDRIERAIEDTQPDLVVLAAQTLHTAAALLLMSRLIHEIGISLAFGGHVFNVRPDLPPRIVGRFLGPELSEAATRIEKLISEPQRPLVPAEPDEAYEIALDKFQAYQSRIEAYTWAHLDEIDVPSVHLNGANRRLGECIVAALRLGDIKLLDEELRWVDGHLQHHGFTFSGELLAEYLRLYRDAVATHMGEDGAIITAWLGDTITQNDA